MRYDNWGFAGSLFVALLAAACGDSDQEEPGGGEDLSRLTPAQLCQKKCQVQTAPGCSRTPSNYATSCAELCLSKYEKFPNCTDAARALDACSIQRVTYGCSETGVISVTPVGACASQGLDCATCTESVLECI